MAGVLVNGGRTDLAPSVRTWLNGLTLRLFTNNHAPAVGDAAAQYTEATFAGYAAVPTTAWGAGAIDANGNVEFDEVQHTFTASGGGLPQTVYGYYLTNGAGTVVFAEADPNPFTLSAAGSYYQVTPKFYLGALAAPY